MFVTGGAGATASTFNSWIQCYQPNPGASFRLLCFPYSGGSARIYRSWAQLLPPSVECCPVQLPGRDSRMAEPPFTNLAQLVQAMGPALRPYLDKPFVFFGHSMGAMLGFELAHYLRAEFDLSPEHFFVSGRAAPQLERTDRPLYDLPEQELLQELRELKGTPPEVLEHPDLMELMLPLLRADFALGDTYAYPVRPPLSCPFTALGGLRDSAVPRASLDAWREQTHGPFSLRMFPGDHFFLHSDKFLLLNLVGRVIEQLANRE